MKKIYISILLVFFYITANGQKINEIGVFLGTAYYMGELNQSKVFYQPDKAVSLLYKINFDSRYALRLSASYVTLKGDDELSDHRYQINRNHKFNVSLTELATMIEFNFLQYKPLSRYDFYSFYLTLGVGMVIIPVEEEMSPFNPIIPFGIGFKYAATKRVGISVEWLYKKTFTDYIDQLSEQTYTQIPTFSNKQITNNQNKDWYSFVGITLTYKFALGNVKCAAYGNN